MLTGSKKRTRQGGFRAQFNTHNGQVIREKEQPKAKQPKELAAAESGGFAGVRRLRDGSTDYGEVDRPDRERASNQITVRRDRGGVVLEIAHDDDLVEIEIDPTSAVNLVAALRLALSEVQARQG